jgi:hypothetical protein
MLKKTRYDHLDAEFSGKPKSYYFELMKKKADNKRLSQTERVFIELYLAKVPIRRPFFHKIMRPAVINVSRCMSTLRDKGFIINLSESWNKQEKNTTYELIKDLVYIVEAPKKKRKKWLGLF